MRAAGILLMLVLSVSLMPETEAGWFRRTWRRVKDFVRDNVRVRVTVGAHRPVRSVETLPTLMGCTLQETLHKYGCDVDEATVYLTRETEAAFFERSDANQDKILDDEEKKMFELMFLAEVLEKCMEKKASMENDVQ